MIGALDLASFRFRSRVLLRELWFEDWIDNVSDLTLEAVAAVVGDTYGTALFLPNSFCSQSSSVDMAGTSWLSLTFLRGRVLLKVLELVTNGDWEPLANPLRTPPPTTPLPDPLLLPPKFFRSSSPPPRFSSEPSNGVEALLTTPKFSETFREVPLLRWDKASNLQKSSKFQFLVRIIYRTKKHMIFWNTINGRS